MSILARAVVAAVVVAVLSPVGCGAPPHPDRSPVGPPARAAGWHPIEAGPLAPRHSANAFWTGSEVLILGGDEVAPICRDGGDCALPGGEPLRDGAALDPATGRWRPLADAPIPLGSATGAIVDDDLHLWVPEGGGGDRVEGTFLAYGMADDRWKVLPDPPGNVEVLELIAAGSRVVAFRGSHERGIVADLVYDPVTASWSDLPMDPLAPSDDRSFVWTGVELVLLAIPLDPARPPNVPPVYEAATFSFGGEGWRRLPDSDVLGWSPSWFWVAGRIVNPSLGTSDGGPVGNFGRQLPHGGMLIPPAGEWASLPGVPERGEYKGVTLGGGEHVISADGAVLHVPTGAWQPLSRPDARENASSVWAEDQLVVWGGVAWNGNEPTLLGDGWAWVP